MIQFLKSIALLSLLQTVFSKRSADTLQYYFGASNEASSNQESHVNSYFIRKHGLAFVQSRAAKYLNSKSEQVSQAYSALSSSSSTTKRNLFSFTLNDIVRKDFKQGKQEKNQHIADPVAPSTATATASAAISKGISLPSWAKRTLFQNYDSVQGIPSQDFHHVSKQGSLMANLAGAVYEESLLGGHLQDAGHFLVAKGSSANVAWMATDSIGYDSDFDKAHSNANNVNAPSTIRTITIRGFDLSDATVDKDTLLNHICDAGKVSFSNGNDDDMFQGLRVHRGLLAVAKDVYQDIKPFIELTDPSHKIVLNGHSIGGALANLVLMLMTAEYGSTFVKDKVQRVYTYGAPPIAKNELENTNTETTSSEDADANADMYKCSVLEALGLPSDMVYGFVEPWDPIVRLFSTIDAMYPLIGDLGSDGFTLMSTGPPRTLRPITRAILESWENWPKLRDQCKDVMKQDYMSVGVQHLLMPTRSRFLSDRIMSVNVNAYPVDDVLRVSSSELYGALEGAFPLDVFSISLVPTAIRSFIHHFSPAYVDGFDYYVKKEERNSKKSASKKSKATSKSASKAKPKSQTLPIEGFEGEIKVVRDPSVLEEEIKADVSLRSSESPSFSRKLSLGLANPATTWVRSWENAYNRAL